MISVPQTQRNQGLNQGKGIHPAKKIVPGLYDFFVFDAHDPAQLMKDFSLITGPAVLPPKWALGYMQSHRTLEDDRQMIGIVDSFRTRKFPLTQSFTWARVLRRGAGIKCNLLLNSIQMFLNDDPESVIADMHSSSCKGRAAYGAVGQG